MGPRAVAELHFLDPSTLSQMLQIKRDKSGKIAFFACQAFYF